MDQLSLINYLTAATQELHAEDQRVAKTLRELEQTGKVTPELFAQLLSAQRVSLRIPANALLMFAAMLEPEEEKTATRDKPSRRQRLLRALRALKGP